MWYFAESELGRVVDFISLAVWYSTCLLFLISLSLTINLNAEDVKEIKANTVLKVKSEYLIKASNFADSAYYSNINGTYQKR